MLALVLHLKPMDFLPLGLNKFQYLIFRLIASFFGVLGFSVMFNSPLRLAATAGLIGAIANTTRLELVDLASFPPAAAAFLGALLAGLLASMIKTSIGYPRNLSDGSFNCYYGPWIIFVFGQFTILVLPRSILVLIGLQKLFLLLWRCLLD